VPPIGPIKLSGKMARKYHKGLFKPKKPEKYMGDHTNIVYRSSWELKYMKWLDHSSSVIQWQSEEFCIPYTHPVDGRRHRYFPDFFVVMKNKQGAIEELVVEIKPKKQSEPPKAQKRQTRRYINEVITYATNQYKWDAAKRYCDERGYKFVVLTENELKI